MKFHNEAKAKHRDHCNFQLTVSDDEFVVDDAGKHMEVALRLVSKLQTIAAIEPPALPTVSGSPVLSTSHSIPRVPSSGNKHPSMDSSLSRRMRAEMIDTRSYRSAGSERSDELSLRSLRRAGGTYKREKMPVSVGIITVMMFIAGGAILFAVWEDWNVFDGAYYSFITLSTIGFGDIVPGQSLGDGSQEKLIVCALYLLFGMALIAMCFKLMQDDVVQKARWLGQKIGILGFVSTQILLMCTIDVSVKEDSSESESEIDEDMVLEEDEEDDVLSDAKTDQDKRTMSSGSSRRDEEEMRHLGRMERRYQSRR
ncbi:unnamed protein product [Anisakis simplex]|uniref:Ion_trans_2 domain-containing protein n=1 Tax=Anisakis simplex TaxID=6269 RepID=A0A0M3K7R3_ANISI|nr:unnamed protein product [Anisakis simplex]